ncbi:phosphotransferase [Streptomyces sp. NPDC012616]|uniref:phosphotransferase n=1 Tax=Streptomyces sp. NPDC012616 TaxID=3364840 RepID=UPI0036E345C1
MPAQPSSPPPGSQPLTTASARLTAAEAERIAAEYYGFRAAARRLDGERDDNFRLRGEDGVTRLMKVTHPAEDPEVTDFHTRVLEHLADSDPGLPVQRLVPTLSGSLRLTITTQDGALRAARMTTYLQGRLLHTVTPTQRPLLREIGRTLARLNRALRTFTHPAAFQPHLWDLQHAHLLRKMTGDIPPGPRRDLLLACLDRFDNVVRPALPALRAQVVHNDFSGDNVLVDDAGLHVSGILDFGDMTHAPVAADVAVAAAYQLADGDDPMGPALDVVAGYHVDDPLTRQELGLLYDLVLTRMVVRIAVTEWRAARFPDNRAYILRNTPRSWAQLEQLLATTDTTVTARLLHACGME